MLLLSLSLAAAAPEPVLRIGRVSASGPRYQVPLLVL